MKNAPAVCGGEIDGSFGISVDNGLKSSLDSSTPRLLNGLGDYHRL